VYFNCTRRTFVASDIQYYAKDFAVQLQQQEISCCWQTARRISAIRSGAADTV